jgi:hypothetical protein
MTSRTYFCSGGPSSVPLGILCQFCRQVRQQVALACWATNTGCPLYGVCLPSLYGNEGNNRVLSSCAACCRTVAIPLASMMALSFSLSRNLARNGRTARASKRLCIRLSRNKALFIAINYKFSISMCKLLISQMLSILKAN